MLIHDGRGMGYKAAVDKHGHVITHSIAGHEIAHYAKGHSTAYFVQIPVILTVPVTEALIFWLKSLDTHMFQIHKLFVGWNGGDTTGSKLVELALYVGASIPSANNSTLSSSYHKGSMDFGAITAPLLEQYYWDGVSTGMTVSDSGKQVFRTFIPKGLTPINLEGSALVSPQAVLAITAKGEEAGKLSLWAMTYFDAEQ